METRFFTITDSRFFVGTVALLNSLRVTGHSQPLVVLDRGLTAEQRAVLGSKCLWFDLPEGQSGDPYLIKPFPALTGFEGLVVLIDSDIIVTDTLEPVLRMAASGMICVYPDHPVDAMRWFADWHRLFDLALPLRRQPYMNAGFIAVSTSHWPAFFARWWDACARIPTVRSTPNDADALSQLDQDALNALLMSEIPDDGVERLPGYYWDLRRVVIEDTQTLRCVSPLGRQPLLHAPLMPKVWQPEGWRRAWPDAYVRLLPRLLFSTDASVRLRTTDVPPWLRPGLLPRLSLHVLAWYGPFRRAVIRARRAPQRAVRESRRYFRTSQR